MLLLLLHANEGVLVVDFPSIRLREIYTKKLLLTFLTFVKLNAIGIIETKRLLFVVRFFFKADPVFK